MTDRPVDLRYRRALIYGGITLIPVDINLPPYCFIRQDFSDAWHVPGRRMMLTAELVSMAQERGIAVVLSERDRSGERTYRLISN